MVNAGRTLFVGGPPDIVHDNDPLGPFEGRWTGEVWAFDSATGATQAKYKLNAYPVFDGMIAADGKLIAALENGVIVCWKDTAR